MRNEGNDKSITATVLLTEDVWNFDARSADDIVFLSLLPEFEFKVK